MNNNINIGLGQSYQGFYKVASVNATTEEVIWESDWNKNLILNQGMDRFAVDVTCDLFTHALAGTGSRPNLISSGDSTITQSGATIRLAPVTGLQDFTSSVVSASQFQYTASVQVGDMIKDSDLSESMVTAVNANGINLTVTPSYTYSNEKTFTIYKTSQRGLHSEVKRYNTYLVGAGNCETTVPSVGKYIHRRTYDFLSESIAKTYTEVGTSWSATQTGSNVFSRMLLPIPIVIDAGFKLRMVYDLHTTISPTTSVYFTASISGWPHALGSASATIATQSIQNVLMSQIYTISGITVPIGGYYILDPASVAGNPGLAIFASSDSRSLAAFGSAVDRSANVSVGTVTTSSYIANSYYLDKTCVWPEGSINISNIRSMGMGGSYSGGSDRAWEVDHQAFCVVFQEPQMKQDTQTLSITFRQSWGRTLA